MDQHFKMERAREEIQWLNIEIPRLTTYICDEEMFLLQCEQSFLLESDPLLSQQLCLHRLKIICSNDLHICRLEKLTTLPGFCGTIAPRMALDNPTILWADTHSRPTLLEISELEEDESDQVDQETEDAADALCLVIEGSS